MKTLITLTYLFFSLSQAKADSANAVAGAALATGAMFALIGTVDSAVSPNEMKMFLDPQTLSTTQISDLNGLLVETRLIEVVQGIYYVFAFKNATDKPITVDANRIKFIFSGGLERYPDQYRISQFVIDPLQKISLIIRANKKSDFNQQNILKIEIPVIQQQTRNSYFIQYNRDPNYVEKSLNDNYIWSLDIEYGRTFFAQNTASQSESSSAGAFALNMEIFGSNQHGFILGFKNFDYPLKNEIKNQLALTGSHFKASLNTAYLGYVYRLQMNEKNSLNSSILLTSAQTEFRDSANTYDNQSTTTLGLRAEGNYLFSKIEEGPYTGSYIFNYGVDYFNLSQFSNQFGDLSGSMASAFIGFKIAY